MDPEVRYCTTEDGVRIAYMVMGSGGTPMIWASLFLNQMSAMAAQPGWLEAAAKSHQLVLFDGRGVGQSQRDLEDYSLSARRRDVEAVVAAMNLERFDLIGEMWSSPVAVAYAVHHPDRLNHLVLRTAYGRAADIVPWERFQPLVELARTNWRLAYQVFYSINTRERVATEEQRRVDELLARGVDGADAARWLTHQYEIDVSDLLPRVTTPTLVLHSRRDRSVPFRLGQDVASRIPGARFVALEQSTDNPVPVIEAFVSDHSTVVDNAAIRTAPKATRAEFRTILFTDIVGHTEMMQRLGDADGRAVLREHERVVRTILSAHRGEEVKTIGDAFMASFTSATRGVECAIALQRAFAVPLGVDSVNASDEGRVQVAIRIGLNAGEPVAEDGDYFGASVTLASRISALADAGEILIPEPVRHLLAGKGFVFADRGEFVPKGFDDTVRVFEVRWRE
jgi:class 3 adenylate cyclase